MTPRLKRKRNLGQLKKEKNSKSKRQSGNRGGKSYERTITKDKRNGRKLPNQVEKRGERK